MEERILGYLSLANDKPRSGKDWKENRSGGSIDELLGQRTRILKTKLEVFASEISERLKIRTGNLKSLIYDDLLLTNALLYFEPSSGKDLYQAKFPDRLYGTRFDIAKERREQDVECWRDVTLVMRDFLAAWEALEQGRARAIFLNNDRESNQRDL